MLILESLLTILHSAILALNKSIGNAEMLNMIEPLLNLHLKTFGVEAEGINIIGALSITFGKLFFSKF